MSWTTNFFSTNDLVVVGDDQFYISNYEYYRSGIRRKLAYVTFREWGEVVYYDDKMGRSWQRAWEGLMGWQYPLTAGECTWWRHDAFRNDGPLLWESPVDSPHKGPAMWSLDAFRVGSPNEPYKQSSYWSFEIVWRPCDGTLMGLDSNNFFLRLSFLFNQKYPNILLANSLVLRDMAVISNV